MQVSGAVSEDSLYLLFAELEKGLEEPTRRSAAAVVLANFCANSKLEYQEHVPSLLTVSVSAAATVAILLCWVILGDCAMLLSGISLPNHN